MIDFQEITQRVTIRDILINTGLKPVQNRMCCPVHNGKNKSSFSFNDSTFICFSCGANGGLVDLVEYLHQYTRADALRHLCGLAGLPFEDNANSNKKNRTPIIRTTPNPLLANDEYCEIKNQLEWLDLYKSALETGLRIIRKNAKTGKIPLVDFYTKEQIYIEELNELDPILILITYKLRKLTKGNKYNGNSRKCDKQRTR